MPANTNTYAREAISIAHFPDRSTRWLFQFSENVQGLIEIIAPALADAIDFDRLTALNRTFISDALREQESDIVYQAPFQDTAAAEPLIIYILIEHQSTVDPTMGFRILSYMMQLWAEQRQVWETQNLPLSERRLSAILPIVFYTGEQRWQAPLSLTGIMDMPNTLSRFVPTFETLFLSVRETSAERLTETDHPFGWLLTVLQQEYADIALIREALIAAVSRLNTLDENRAAERYRAIAYLLHFILHRREAKEHTDLITVVKDHSYDTEVEPMAQSMAEVLMERGMEQGMERGQVLAKRDAILKLLRRQFGDVPESLVSHITALHHISQLDALFEKALEAEGLDDIDW